MVRAMSTKHKINFNGTLKISKDNSDYFSDDQNAHSATQPT